MEVTIPANGWRPRPHQLRAWTYLERGGRHAIAVWHRRAGKDEIALNWACVAAHKRIGNYWHMLPEYRHARRAMWDAINPHTAKRRIDEAFPVELRRSTNNVEMKIELKCGSIWQLVGSDDFDSLMGAPPIGIVHSEYGIADPRAAGYLRPIITENHGWQLFIYTPRGYNHGYSTYETARSNNTAFAELLSIDQTHLLNDQELQDERQWYVDTYGEQDGDALFRQEYKCDFSAANLGSILGAQVEKAERDGRIVDEDLYDPDDVVHASSDIGHHDTCAWWFWQRKLNGKYNIIDYDADRGLEALDWLERLQAKGYRYGHIWLPQDAKNKTWASKRSGVEQFISGGLGEDEKRVQGFGAAIVKVVPAVKIADRINAARNAIRNCRFARTKTKTGLDALRSWAFEYDAELRSFSREPKHDWASHGGDAFSYGATVMRPPLAALEPEKGKILGVGQTNQVSLDELWEWNKRLKGEERRI